MTFRAVLFVVGLQTAMNLPMSVWNGLLSGLQAFHVTNAIGVVLTLVRGALTVTLVWAGYGVVAIVGASFAATLGAWAVTWWCVHRRIPGLRVGFGGFRRARLGDIGRFSVAMIVWTIAGASLHQLDRVLIGAVLPVASLTTYEIGARLSMYSRSILFSWLSVVMPATSALVTRGERARLRALYLRSTRYVFTTYAGVAVALVGFGAPFVRLWMGDGFETSYAVMCLLVAGNLMLSQNGRARDAAGHGRGSACSRASWPSTRSSRSSARRRASMPAASSGSRAASRRDARDGARFPRDVVRTRFDVSFRCCRRSTPVLKALLPVAAWIVAVRVLVPLGSWRAPRVSRDRGGSRVPRRRVGVRADARRAPRRSAGGSAARRASDRARAAHRRRPRDGRTPSRRAR